MHISERKRVFMKFSKKLVVCLLIISISIPFLTFTTAASPDNLVMGGATVNTDVLNLRSGPSTSHSVITTISRNTVIVVYSRANSDWLRVNYHGRVGYVTCQFLRDILPARNFAALGRVTSFLVNIRSRPYTASSILSVVSENTNVDVIGVNNGWFKVQHGSVTGYIRSDLMSITGAPRPGVLPAHSTPATSGNTQAATSGNPAPTPAAPIAAAPAASAPDPNLPLAEQVIEFAKSLLGTRYVWGGASRAGFDCSGFVTYVMRNFDITVRRVANDQFNHSGTRIPRAELAPGDLVFFSSNGGRSITHVGIYIGDNEFIHSSSARTGVIISRLDTSWHTSTFAGANRVLPSPETLDDYEDYYESYYYDEY